MAKSADCRFVFEASREHAFSGLSSVTSKPKETTKRCQFPVLNSSEHRADFSIQRCVRVCAATPDRMVMHTTAPLSRSDLEAFKIWSYYILINRPLFTYNNDG